MMKNRFRRFTLIELLVVVAVIGILVSLLLPALSKAKESARTAYCLSNSKEVALAHINYYNDQKTLFVPSHYEGYDWATQDDWAAMLLPYTAYTYDVFDCKSLKNHPTWKTPRDSNDKPVVWAMNGWIGGGDWYPTYRVRHFSQVEKPSSCVIFLEKPFRSCETSIFYNPVMFNAPVINSTDPRWYWFPHMGKLHNCAFVDGHARSIPRSELYNNSNEYFCPKPSAVP